MVTAVEVFRYDSAPIRTVVRDGEPWFVARDVCAVLGITNGRDAVARLDADGVGTADVIDSMGRTQTAAIVSEPGLYELIFQSRKPEAKAFRRWVTNEVLPTIRRTGRYEVAPSLPQTYAQALRELAATVERAEQIQRELETAAPKAEAWDVLASAHGDYSVREAAFILNRDPAINTGQRRLFQLLRDWKLIDRRDIPYADHARHVRLRARTYEHPRTGEPQTSEQVRITAEGLRYLHRRMGGVEPLAA